MGGLGVVAVVAVVAVVVVAVVVGMVALVARSRRRRNQVRPGHDTGAPVSWAGAHTPLARLHRRLVAAAAATRTVPDPGGALIRARVDIERAAVGVDERLVALHGLSERERAGRMAEATTAVAAVEDAAARLADAAAASRSTGLDAVDEALERANLVAEARRELDREPDVVDESRSEPATEDGSARADAADTPPRSTEDDAGEESGRGRTSAG